ncbi:MAG: outer membrane lipoprotein carrier protein LolA [Desulfomonile tiedjei]|nr:outer membrane lipoprotein carrier protein LolA [Desulfomonile tiedjei]
MFTSVVEISKRLVLGVSAVVMLGACAAKVPVNGLQLEDLIRDAEKKAYLVKQFRADFTKTRLTSVFNRDVTVKCRLVFQKPDRFLLTMTGDANVEILSDGTMISLMHDQKDREVYHVQGERDLARFSDPFMLLIKKMENGGLRAFSEIRRIEQPDGLIAELQPGNDNQFERIKSVLLSFGLTGDIKKISILFKDGERDEVVFDSWTLLAQDDPEVVQLETKLKALSKSQPDHSPGAAPSPLSMAVEQH